jgi:hypothetical protein
LLTSLRQIYESMTEGYEPAGYPINPGCPAPDIVVIKDLIHLYVCTVRGTGCPSQNELATVDSTYYSSGLLGQFVAVHSEETSQVKHEIYG